MLIKDYAPMHSQIAIIINKNSMPHVISIPSTYKIETIMVYEPPANPAIQKKSVGLFLSTLHPGYFMPISQLNLDRKR